MQYVTFELCLEKDEKENRKISLPVGSFWFQETPIKQLVRVNLIHHIYLNDEDSFLTRISFEELEKKIASTTVTNN